MNRNIEKSSIGKKSIQIIVAKNCIFWLYSDRFTPAPPRQNSKLLLDVPEIEKIYQTKVETARLALSENPF